LSKLKKRIPSERDLNIWKTVRHDLLDWQYYGISGVFQKAGHRLISKWSRQYADKIVLEVGCGNGHHLRYAFNTYRRYIGLDIERKFLQTFQFRFPNRILIQGDAYMLPFRDHSADCVLSLYNFEHLKFLSDSLSEIHRVLKPEGELLIGIPMEGGFLYGVGRRLTSKPYMERKYGIDYDAIVQWEHCNTCRVVMEEIRKHFIIRDSRYLPFFIPSIHVNVILNLRALPR
jgi:SAM-dependent methyltransferase